MTTLATIWLWLLALALLGLMTRQYLRGTHDLISVRNVAIVGFLVFQVVSAAQFLSAGAPTRTGTHLEQIGTTSLIYAFMATAFAAIFLWAYERGFWVRRLAHRIPISNAVPSHATLWLIAFGLLGLAAFLRLGITIPLIAQLGMIVGITCAAVACGIAGWIWGPRLKNPAVLVMVLIVAFASMLIVSQGAYGRRGIIALGGALAWGVYFSHLRYQRSFATLAWLTLILAGPVAFTAAFTAARDFGSTQRSMGESLSAIRHSGNLRRGFDELLSGQDAAQNSMWLLEVYPEQFKSRPLFTLYFSILYPLPRAIWPNKPQALGQIMPHQAQLENVDRDALNLGPGIIGHIAAEGRWYALVIYAFLGGLLIRLLDEIVSINAWTPLVVVPIGSALGQVVGLARGETSAFVAILVLGTCATYVILLAVGKLLENTPLTSAVPYDDESDWGYEGAYDDDCDVPDRYVEPDGHAPREAGTS